MSKHTPGPWKVEHRGYKYIVSKSRDGYITRDVCRMDGSTMAAFAQEANARLIAAAPELLDVLELALRAHGTMLLSDPPQDPWVSWAVEQKARAAIAKATGVLAEGDSEDSQSYP